MLPKFGISSVLIGATSPPAIKRKEASPEAETTSYSPPRMSWTISSLVAPTLRLTLQLVSFSKAVTQSASGLVEPSSTNPAQATMLTWPSESPIEVAAGMSGTWMPLLLEAAVLPPQAARTSESDASPASGRNFFVRFMMVCLP